MCTPKTPVLNPNPWCGGLRKWGLGWWLGHEWDSKRDPESFLF